MTDRQEVPMSQQKLHELLTRAIELSGKPKEEVIASGLRLFVSQYESSGVNGESALSIAGSRKGGITMDELLDEMYPNEPVFHPHAKKIQLGQVLTSAGYKRKQARRGNDRVLIWSK
jgi:hypothetical protein